MSRMIPEVVIDDVRSQVNILDIVEQYVQMHRSGKNWFGLCPFHPETSGSFSVNEQKQIFTCFSCHRGGNVFKFMMEIENLDFPAAVIRVAELGNIKIDSQYADAVAAGENGGASDQDNSTTRTLKEYHREAAELYHHILVNTQLGESALEYLHQRGLSDDLITEFQLGYAPSKRLLMPFFSEHQPDYQLLRKSGLFVESQDGKLNDRFTDRVMFPLRNAVGQVIGFSGRLLAKNDNKPKYLNSPETELFNKREVLFNFDKARVEARREKSIVLFEGFMDVLAAYRSGVKNGVASMGTSLTEQQVYTLARATKNISICYDGDEPGQNATKRALELLNSVERFGLSVITLPEKLDPDEYVKKYGAEKFADRVHHGKTGELDFYFSYYQQDRNLTNEQDQLGYIDDVLHELARSNDPIEQDLYLNRIAERFQITKSNLETQLRDVRASLQADQQKVRQKKTNSSVPSSVPDRKSQAPVHLTRVEQAERLLLYRLLHEHSIWLKVQSLPEFSFVHENYQTLYLLAQGYFNQYQEYDSASFLDFVQESALQQIVVALEMNNYAEQASEMEINDCLRLILEASPLEEKIHSTNDKLAHAKRMNDQDQVTLLTVELIKLLQRKQAAISAI
ncbi:DNA primase [Ligilactobacillus salitolerans]|uniref:DNA primase n=1 Tax=Ligilactobacillus salitolerans TaxID=1808352 RepID=A0A401IU11_9LACO|nr:DNA primase [Ligilactobacillus salitolerans]GBG95022.1 DNA primase [Ligilactobacillus salitolerans]